MSHIHPSLPGKIVSIRRETRWGDCTMYGVVDGKEENLFSFYIDELGFSNEELIGLTISQAIDLKHKRDVEYLRS